MATAERDDTPVLILAPIGRDGPAVAELLRRAGVASEICRNLTELLDRIEIGASAALVAEEAVCGKDVGPLLDWVKRQPAWSDLPFIILTGQSDHPSVATWRQGLVDMLHNVALLERPAQGITLTSTVLAAIRARRRQYQVEALLDIGETTALELEALVQARTSALEEANRQLHAEMAERARIEESLRRAQKIEALGQLTGGVAHDFNNLLMVISGGLDMLDRHFEREHRGRILERMRQATQRGAGLTRQLLAFSRRQSLSPEPVDLMRQIGGMRELLDRSLGGEIHVRVEFPPDLWPVEVDPGELELVVLNLAVNARDAMPAGGTIVIRAVNAPKWADDEARGDFVCLSVVDSGTGMSPEVQARIFEPFYTTKEVGKGSGLGLAQAYGFAQQSGGRIQVTSELDRGTIVALYLPRSHKTPSSDPAHSQNAPANREEHSSTGSVLLVEDDDEVASLVAEMLEQLGYEVTRAASGVAALGALANGRHVDIMFSDIMMPGGMNGVELAREVRARRRDVAILLTSGNAGSLKHNPEGEGFQLLRKPYKLEELAAALAHIDGGRPSVDA